MALGGELNNRLSKYARERTPDINNAANLHVDLPRAVIQRCAQAPAKQQPTPKMGDKGERGEKGNGKEKGKGNNRKTNWWGSWGMNRRMAKFALSLSRVYSIANDSARAIYKRLFSYILVFAKIVFCILLCPGY